MNEFVLDASFALRWCFEDEDSEQAESVLKVLQVRGAVAIVPSIWQHEILNALGKAVGRKRLDLPRANEFWKQLSYLPIFVIELSVDAKLLELAVRHALSVYDASYLALAVARQVPLASFDGKLLKAAESIGVQILRIQPPPAPIQ